MTSASIKRLRELCEIIPPLLNMISDEELSIKPLPNKWSKKEIFGHLIDSAVNNHQRFIRTQFEDVPTIIYDQNNWNKYNQYNKIDKDQLISFWTAYNRQLAFVLSNIPEDSLKRLCDVGTEHPQTTEWLFDDYVSHQEYHLKQIVSY
jgi:DinB superfamily